MQSSPAPEQVGTRTPYVYQEADFVLSGLSSSAIFRLQRRGLVWSDARFPDYFRSGAAHDRDDLGGVAPAVSEEAPPPVTLSLPPFRYNWCSHIKDK
jgi:hypothetical protein